MGAWGEYILAWACFLGAHVIPAARPLRGWLIGRIGRRGYLAAFSLLSLVLLYWLIKATGRAPFVPLWDAGMAGRWLVNLAMPLAILSVTLAVGLPGLVSAFAIWSAAHLIANGDLSHLLFFGGMLIFALTGLLRSGLPGRFRVTPLRIVAAVVIWATLLHLHPLVIGVSPLPG
ncbi:NnrU family protein [Paracoccus caeni]|uniref:NnrU family protein n=2 Tax=Paracoccus caeni TaxID=657651 RepID=A0A934SCV1_9RHOB|nr:NnrU family protein [Paracoccus caeni]